MRKFILLVGLIVFLTPMVVSAVENDKDAMLKQLELNKEIYAKFILDQKNNPLPICALEDKTIIKIAKKCKAPFDNDSDILNNIESDEILYDLIVNDKGCKGIGSYLRRLKSDDEISYKCKSLLTKYKCVSKKRDAAIKKLKCETRTLEDYGYVKNIESHFKKYKEFSISLGCNSNKGISKIDECVARYLPSVIGSSPMSISDLDLIKNDWSAMNEIQKAIEEMSRQQNQSQNEPSEEEKQQALAQENSSGQVTWKYTPGGIGYWDYGNGFGWAPPNPKRDKIIQGLLVSQRTKNFLMTGSKGKIVFVPR
jgi:hypothetical protein